MTTYIIIAHVASENNLEACFCCTRSPFRKGLSNAPNETFWNRNKEYNIARDKIRLNVRRRYKVAAALWIAYL